MAHSSKCKWWLGASAAAAVVAVALYLRRPKPAIKNSYVSDSIKKYVFQNSVQPRELPVQRDLRLVTQKLPKSGMQISPDQGGVQNSDLGDGRDIGQFFQLFLKAMKARRVLEIGVFTGYSSLSMALALPEDGQLVACDVSEEWTNVARRFWKQAGVAHKIDLRLAPAVDTLDELLKEGEDETFDFAFIDADKVNYTNYYERCLRLVRTGGFIAIDNVLWHGRVTEEEDQSAETIAIRNLNSVIRKDRRVEMVLMTISDGVTLCRKREVV